MYVQVLLIKMHRGAAGVAARSALLSEWHKTRCSSEWGKKSKVTSFSQATTSETRPKWLVQKVGVIGKVIFLPNHNLGYTKRKITLYYNINTFFSLCLHTGYCLVMVM